MQDIAVGAVNFHARCGEIKRNLNGHIRWAEELADKGVELISFPEMSLSGYDRTAAVREFCLSRDSLELFRLQELSNDRKISLLAGFPETAGSDKLYISQALISPECPLQIYSKTHLGPSESDLFRPGEDPGVMTLEKCRIGMQLCYDAHFPELSTSQALSGAEVFFVSSASPRETPSEKRERMLRYLPARAYDNSCFMVACSLCGRGLQSQEFSGIAFIISPKGEILAEAAGSEEMAVTAILKSDDFDRIRATKMGYFLSRRRPDLYK